MNLPVSPHQYTLISILMDAGTPLLSKDLSAKTGISTRSVKKNIAELNDLLAEKKLYISSNTHKGYWIEDKDSFLQWFREMDTSSPVPMTHNQRIIYCLFHLLKYDHPSPTTQWIADSLYVSKATISSVFKDIREIVEAAGGVELKSVKTGGFLLIGEESDLRHLFSSVVFLYYDLERTFLKRTAMDCFQARATATPLHELLIREFSELEIFLNDRDLLTITLDLLFGAFRTMNGHELTGQELTEEPHWIRQAERCLNVHFSPAEQGYYVSLLETLKSFEQSKTLRKRNDDNEQVLEEFYAKALHQYGISLRDYRDLHDYLSRLITYKGFEGIAVPGPGFFRLSDHPFAYALANLFQETLEAHSRPRLSKEDLMELTALISIVLNGNAQKIRALILTELRSGYQEYLSYRLMTHFSYYINWIDTKPLYYIKRKEQIEAVDLILCTSKNALYSAYGKQMNHFPKEILYISSDLTPADLRTVEHYIHDYLPSRSGKHFRTGTSYK
ncbi:MAG: HTH domain-containing protein [Solobacterium sp.]|nr:HTH domain-containing protein [Solobacterium sp.]